MIRDADITIIGSYIDRPKLTWPQGKKIAFWVAPNIENYEFDRRSIRIDGRCRGPCRM